VRGWEKKKKKGRREKKKPKKEGRFQARGFGIAKKEGKKISTVGEDSPREGSKKKVRRKKKSIKRGW